MGHFKNIIEEESKKDYYINLKKFVEEEYDKKTIYPERKNIYAALEKTPYENVKVVILGQDPYHGEGEAHGLSFSVCPGIKIPPSLKNIYKELNSELGCYIPNNGYLDKWAKQGVLLLNTVLTVEAHKPKSHSGKGWETFTTETIKYLNAEREGLVFILWGRDARNKKSLIDVSKHLILESAHPSPLSAYSGFFGNKHFSKCNKYLAARGVEPIIW